MSFGVYMDRNKWWIRGLHGNGLVTGPFKTREKAYQWRADELDRLADERFKSEMISQFLEG